MSGQEEACGQNREKPSSPKSRRAPHASRAQDALPAPHPVCCKVGISIYKALLPKMLMWIIS